MKLELANINDFKTISALAGCIWIDTFYPDGLDMVGANYIAEELSANAFAKRSIEDRDIYKVTIDNMLVGFMEIAFDNPSDHDRSVKTQIDKLYIHRNYHRIGIGARFIETMDTICRNRGIDKYWLSVFEENKKAISFYEKNGFVKVGYKYFEMENDKYINHVMFREL